MDEKLLNLLERKSFDELSPAEKELVLAHMSEANYMAQHKVIASSRLLFEEEAQAMIPSPQILIDLQTKAKKQKPQTAFASLLNFQLPAYQSALALAAMAIFIWIIWPEPQTNIVEKEVLVYQPVHDTVEVEIIKEIPVEKIVTVVKEVAAATTAHTEYAAISSGITPQAEPIKADAITQNLANTSLDADRLSQFIVGVN